MTGNPDGVVYLDRVGQLPVADLLQFLFDSFYETNPRFKPREGELRQLLRNARALILLDDVKLADRELDAIFNALPNSLFCLASEERCLHGEVKAIALRGLSRDDALALIEGEFDKPLTAEDRAAAQAVYEVVEGYPARLILALAQARERGKTLAELGTEGATTLSSVEFLRRTVESRSVGERRVLVALCVLGVFISKEALATLAPTPALEPALQALLDAKLIKTDGAAYALSAGIKDAVQAVADLIEGWAEALPYFVRWTEQNHRETQTLLGDAGAIERAIEWAAQQSRWPEVLRLVRASESSFSANGRWMAWGKLLEIASRAARELGNRDSEAWALHQLGSRAMCMGDKVSAYTLFNQALELRIAQGDHWGASVTRHNLDLLRTSPAVDNQPPKNEESKLDEKTENGQSPISKIPLALKVAGGALFAIATGLVATTLTRHPSAPFTLNFTPPRLEFHSPAVNFPSAMQTVTVSNGASQPLTIQAVALGGESGSDFTVTADDCGGKTLTRGAGCSVSLVFTPTAAMPKNATLVFTDRGGQQTSRLELRGEVEQLPAHRELPRISLQPKTVEFGSRDIGSRAQAEIMLTNSGTAPLRVSEQAIIGAHARDFAMPDRGC